MRRAFSSSCSSVPVRHRGICGARPCIHDQRLRRRCSFRAKRRRGCSPSRRRPPPTRTCGRRRSAPFVREYERRALRRPRRTGSNLRARSLPPSRRRSSGRRQAAPSSRPGGRRQAARQPNAAAAALAPGRLPPGRLLRRPLLPRLPLRLLLRHLPRLLRRHPRSRRPWLHGPANKRPRALQDDRGGGAATATTTTPARPGSRPRATRRTPTHPGNRARASRRNKRPAAPRDLPRLRRDLRSVALSDPRDRSGQRGVRSNRMRRRGTRGEEAERAAGPPAAAAFSRRSELDPYL